MDKKDWIGLDWFHEVRFFGWLVGWSDNEKGRGHLLFLIQVVLVLHVLVRAMGCDVNLLCLYDRSYPFVSIGIGWKEVYDFCGIGLSLRCEDIVFLKYPTLTSRLDGIALRIHPSSFFPSYLPNS